MPNDNPLDRLSEQQASEFMESLYETADLLSLKEFDNFSLNINFDDPECQDFILEIHHSSLDEKVEAIQGKGSAIIKKYFNRQKKKELYGLLEMIEEKYFKKNKKRSRSAYTGMLLLDDRLYDASNLPLLIVRFGAELLQMEEEIFTDPAYFSDRGKNHLRNDQFEEAEKFFLLERQIDDSHWSSYENLAEVFLKKGDGQKAKEQITEALKRVYRCWKEEQECLDFEVAEEIEQKADEIHNRDRSVYIQRLSGYAYGFLYFLGASPLGVIVEEIQALVPGEKHFTARELSDCLEKDTRLRRDGDVFYLREIEDPHLILDELESRKLKQTSPYSLSALKLADEGRVGEFFFSDSDDARDMDDDLRRFTDNELNLVNVYEELRKDVADRKHHDLLVKKMLSERSAHIQEIAEIFNLIWNHFPRWELGGLSPFVVSEKRKAEGLAPELHTHLTSFKLPDGDLNQPQKIRVGRNEPCPCGSGKKYKKCCGR